jgi:hypothetical protein
MIGAAAAALHNYIRATQDVDLCSNVHPELKLRALERKLRDLGLHTTLRLPDEVDELGGVLDVRENADDDAYVQVVNFYNPLFPRRTPAPTALKAAIPMREANLKYATLASLIALKLDANGPGDQRDVLELLARNPEADISEIRRVCSETDLQDRLDVLLSEHLSNR